jgi:hypothetical protein
MDSVMSNTLRLIHCKKYRRREVMNAPNYRQRKAARGTEAARCAMNRAGSPLRCREESGQVPAGAADARGAGQVPPHVRDQRGPGALQVRPGPDGGPALY